MHILKMGVSQPECAAYVVSVFLLKHGVASIVLFKIILVLG